MTAANQDVSHLLTRLFVYLLSTLDNQTVFHYLVPRLVISCLMISQQLYCVDNILRIHALKVLILTYCNQHSVNTFIDKGLYKDFTFRLKKVN